MKNKEYTTQVENQSYPEDPLVPLDLPFEDIRGKIQNLLNCQIGSVAIITSKSGSVRSNHWHKNNWHYLYIISGHLKYYERSLNGSNVIETEFKTGDMFFTPPNAVHKTEFITDTIMMSFGKDSKDHNSHENDIVRENY